MCDMPEPAPATAPVFSLDIEPADDHALVLCHGRLVAGVSDVLYREVSKLLPGAKRIVLDLTDLSKMDSMGLGSIVRLYVSCKSAGTELQLINLGPRIRQLLGMTHLLSAFTVIGDNNVIIP
jgi:anti-sigma B factor antagonist